jgi:Domain of unknown function (DUF4173)
MTDYAAPAAASRAASHVPLKLATVTGLTALADALFYDQRPGLSVTLFAVALVCASLALNHTQLDRRRGLAAGLVFVAGILPAIEELNLLSLLFAILSLTTSIAMMTNPAAGGLRTPLTALRQLLLIGPFRLGPDLLAAARGPALTRGLLLWCVPLAFGLVFVALFAEANPLIAQWVDIVSPDRVVAEFNVLRALFWLAMLSLIWPFLQLRWRTKAPRPVVPAEPVTDTPEPGHTPLLADLFGPSSIQLSLFLFNLLFAVQTVLDMIYLWGHAALPDGMTYAAYAHHGAYPLMLTALLAAGFVLIAIRPGDTKPQPALIRPLVYLWVGQNVLLVLSAMLRLELYVEIYLLTYWRVAAAIWMGLVAAGLVLIVIRIARGRSNRWLVRMNLFALIATLYLCSLINFDAIIAGYNVAHSQEAGGAGAAIDANYLESLGPQALPAIEKALQLRKSDGNLWTRHDRLLEMQQRDMASWKTWGFRSFRLQHYLNTHPVSTNPG